MHSMNAARNMGAMFCEEKAQGRRMRRAKKAN